MSLLLYAEWPTFESLWRQYDNDGWPDLAILATDANYLCHNNNGDGTFSESNSESATNPFLSTGSSAYGGKAASKVLFGDYDGDGGARLAFRHGRAPHARVLHVCAAVARSDLSRPCAPSPPSLSLSCAAMRRQTSTSLSRITARATPPRP